MLSRNLVVCSLAHSCAPSVSFRLDSSACEIIIRIDDEETHEHLLFASRMDHVIVEVLGYHGHFLTFFSDGELVPVLAPDIIRSFYTPETREFSVALRRAMPLSSAHGGQPLRLAFHFRTGVVAISESFTVLAKQGKAGSHKKILRPKRVPPLSADRLAARAAIERSIAQTGGAVLHDVVGGVRSRAAMSPPHSSNRVVLPILSETKRPRVDQVAYVTHIGATTGVTSIESPGHFGLPAPPPPVAGANLSSPRTVPSFPVTSMASFGLIGSDKDLMPEDVVEDPTEEQQLAMYSLLPTPTLDMLAAAAAADDSPAHETQLAAPARPSYAVKPKPEQGAVALPADAALVVKNPCIN